MRSLSSSEIVAKAREFLWTKFQHQGRIKKIGVDCLGLALMVCEELELVDVAGRPILGRDYLVYPETPVDGFIHAEFKRRALEKPATQARPGDFVTMRFLSPVSHCGVLTDLQGGLGVIHCNSTVGRVVEHGLTARCLDRIVAGVFTFPGITR